MAVSPSFVTGNFDDWVRDREGRLEWVTGEVIELVSNNYAAEITAILSVYIGVFILQNGLGRVTTTDGCYQIGEERYIPDFAFVSFERQPSPSHEASNPIPPDLAVEVISNPANIGELTTLRRKVTNYLAVGTVVWIVHPDERQVEVHAPGAGVRIYDETMTLDGAPVLPGFTLSVAEIFPKEING
jgi:Uma2 family endonuclease